MRFTPSSDIILIGSIRVGKNVIAKLINDQFAIPNVLLDDFRRKFYAKVASSRHRPFHAFQ
jgi:2-phosphoglycerate kinase